MAKQYTKGLFHVTVNRGVISTIRRAFGAWHAAFVTRDGRRHTEAKTRRSRRHGDEKRSAWRRPGATYPSTEGDGGCGGGGKRCVIDWASSPASCVLYFSVKTPALHLWSQRILLLLLCPTLLYEVFPLTAKYTPRTLCCTLYGVITIRENNFSPTKSETKKITLPRRRNNNNNSRPRRRSVFLSLPPPVFLRRRRPPRPFVFFVFFFFLSFFLKLLARVIFKRVKFTISYESANTTPRVRNS